MVKRDVNKMVVNAIAKIPIRFLVLDDFSDFKLSLLIQDRFDTLIIPSPPCDNAAIFNTDDPVCHLGNLFIVCNHDDGLLKFLTGNL